MRALENMGDQKIYQAATMVLVKVSTKSTWPYSVLLVKRDASAQFLPGAHVFPGGRVDESDARLSDLFQDEIERIQKSFLSDQKTASSYLAAAFRETLEEAGISALKGSNGLCSSDFLRWLIKGGEPKFRSSLDNIWPISWWITPKGEVRRFDTWFFLGLIDEADIKESLQYTKEVLHPQWFLPEEALHAHQTGHIFLAPPTRAILERLANTTSLEHFLSFVDQPLRPIKPYFVPDPKDPRQDLLVLPGDPLHEEKARSSLPMHTRYRFKPFL